MTEPTDREHDPLAPLLDELAAAHEHQLGVLRRGHSDYIRENGRHGGSPWGELMAAWEAVLDARHAGIIRADRSEGTTP